jgi:L-alanine-DL-glutamate epimerase-like enolase superfamily enzyme
MKITHIEPIFVSIPYDHGAPKPIMGDGMIRETMDALYVRVDTDAGITGWGEAYGFATCPVTMAALSRVIAPMATGRDASDIPALMDDLFRKSKNMGRNGPIGFALSGLDIALWDIAGKSADKPIHRLLGGLGTKTRIPTYASLLRLGTPENVQRVCSAAVARGYKHIKLHERTVEAVAAAREAIGPQLPLMLDTNCTWTAAGSIAMVRSLRKYDLKWLEEPLYPPDDFQALAALRREGGIPIAAGENLGNLNEFKQILDADAVDVVQPDVIKMGGITEVWKALQHALMRGVAVEPHSPYYGPGLIASLHMIAAMPGDAMCEFFYSDLETSPLGDVIYARDGQLRVPNGPGLGIDVDETVLARYRKA